MASDQGIPGNGRPHGEPRDFDDYAREFADEFENGPASPLEIRECSTCHQMCRPFKASGCCSWCVFLNEVDPGWTMPKWEDE